MFPSNLHFVHVLVLEWSTVTNISFVIRQLKWIKNVGQESLLLNLVSNTKSKFLCPNHFTPSSFWNKDRKRLHRNAVPTLLLPQPLTEEQMAPQQIVPQTNSSEGRGGKYVLLIRDMSLLSTYNCTEPLSIAVKRNREEGDEEVDDDLMDVLPDPKIICLEPPPEPTTPRSK